MLGSGLLGVLASELNIDASAIRGFELCVCDSQVCAPGGLAWTSYGQDAVVGGLNNEFVYSARLDNLACSFTAVEALAETSKVRCAGFHKCYCSWLGPGQGDARPHGRSL